MEIGPKIAKMAAWLVVSWEIRMGGRFKFPTKGAGWVGGAVVVVVGGGGFGDN